MFAEHWCTWLSAFNYSVGGPKVIHKAQVLCWKFLSVLKSASAKLNWIKQLKLSWSCKWEKNEKLFLKKNVAMLHSVMTGMHTACMVLCLSWAVPEQCDCCMCFTRPDRFSPTFLRTVLVWPGLLPAATGRCYELPTTTCVCLLGFQFASGECVCGNTGLPVPAHSPASRVPGQLLQSPSANPPDHPPHSPYPSARALHLGTQCVHEPSQHRRCVQPWGTVSLHPCSLISLSVRLCVCVYSSVSVCLVSLLIPGSVDQCGDSTAATFHWCFWCLGTSRCMHSC